MNTNVFHLFLRFTYRVVKGNKMAEIDISSKKKKILIIISTPPFAWETGGCARGTYEMCKELAKTNTVNLLTTDIYTPTKRYDQNKLIEVIDNVKIIRFNVLSYYLAWKYKIYLSLGMNKFIKNKVKEYDVVHLHDLISPQAVVTAYYCKKFNIPYVFSAHGSLFWLKQNGILNKLYYKFGLNIIKEASKLIALNDIEKNQYIELGGDPKNIEIVPNSIDNKDYENLPKPGHFRKKYGIENKKIILYLGRINKIKGIDLLIDAFSLINKKDTILVIIGPDEGFLSKLKLQVKKLGIKKQVLFIGPLFETEKFEAYIDADIYVLPSRYEMFPHTVLESLACGTPVIITEKCCISNLIGESGKVTIFDKVSLKNDIIELLDKKNNKKSSIYGKKLVKQKFDIKITANQMVEIYDSISQKKHMPHHISNR